MTLIGLRFILEGGQFLNVAVTEQEARDMILKFMSGNLPAYFGDTSPQGGWAIESRRLVGMHLMSMEQATAPGMVTNKEKGIYRSGLMI